jgi:prepilin signal peptidase PulO-like enzyme (type II secretory pathway)
MVIIFLIFFGLVLGSFVNAYVWRLHAQSKPGKHSKLSIMHGRSICPHCDHILAWNDLVPVFSWLYLKGKCRYCSKSISVQYPLVEIITMLLFIFSYIYWPYSFNSEGIVTFIFWLVFLVGFVSLTVYDLRWRLLPNKIVSPLIMLALIEIFIKFVFFSGGFTLLLGSLWGLLLSAGIFYVIFVVSNGKWIGGGDVKLAIILGLLLGGPLMSILMVFLASLIGTAIALILSFFKKLKKDHTIAFGPMLISSTYICYLFGPQIIAWYKTLVI